MRGATAGSAAPATAAPHPGVVRAISRETAKILRLCLKDLRIEWRNLDNLPSMFFFSLLVIVIFNFGFSLAGTGFETAGPGILWVAFVFAGVLSFGHSFAIEKDSACLQGLRLAPIDPGSIFLGKMLANLIAMLAVEALVLPLCVLLFNATLAGVFWELVVVILVHTIGFAAVGTLFGAMAARTRRGDVLLPVLLFGVSMPLMISAVKTTAAALTADAAMDQAAGAWLVMALTFDVVFVTASYLTFEYIIEE